jgi:hypothetical protein
MGMRVNRLSRLWEKYRVNRIDFQLDLVGPTTDDVAVAVAFDTDVMDADPPYTADGVQELLSYNHSMVATHSASPNSVLSVRLQQPDSGFFTNEVRATDPRLVYVGQLYVYVITPPATATYGLRVMCSYDITLFEPEISPVSGASGPSMENMTAADQPATGVGVGWAKSVVTEALRTLASELGLKLREPVAGKVGIELTPGRYIFEQLYQQNSAGTNVGFEKPSVYVSVESSSNDPDDYAYVTEEIDVRGAAFNDIAINRCFIEVATPAVILGEFQATGYTETGTSAFAFLLGRVY